jgi:hypothetical protein
LWYCMADHSTCMSMEITGQDQCSHVVAKTSAW